MILRIAIVIGVLIAGILVFAATKPNLLHIQRSILINASPDNIFALINNFHSWSGWAPQDQEDSTMTRTYSGAAYGNGAVSDWNRRGQGRQGAEDDN
jgi:hypothetical protein